MSLTLKVGDPATTLQASFLDRDGNPDTAGKISFASDNPAVTISDNGDGTASVTAASAGSATVTATDTDPDGNTVTTPPFAVTVVDSGHDAVTGSITVVGSPQAPAAAPAAAVAPAPTPAPSASPTSEPAPAPAPDTGTTPPAPDTGTAPSA
jgi:hypothetical protein